MIDEGLVIDSKTIIINESKSYIPKRIKNFSIKEEYDKDSLVKTLIFTLNKLIRKIHYYSEYMKMF